MSTLIVGDIHGKIDIFKKILKTNQPSVFVGDYVDSFTKNYDEQIEILDLIIDTAKQRNDVTFLMGNHEASYMVPRMHCSGWSPEIQAAVDGRLDILFSILKHYVVVDNYLVTHAGVSAAWLPRKIKKDLAAVAAYLETRPNKLWDIGTSRGGYDPIGGPLWCDHYYDYRDVQGLNQVFGHTASREPGDPPGIFRMYDYDYNVDCLDRVTEILEISGENSAKIVQL